MDAAIPSIKKNALLVIDWLGPLSDVVFGLNRESVMWVEGYIERQRTQPDFNEAAIDRLVHALGSFVGECIIANAGGSWKYFDEHQTWGVAFSSNWSCFPFHKVRKQLDNGLKGGDSIVAFYDIVVSHIATGKLSLTEGGESGPAPTN